MSSEQKSPEELEKERKEKEEKERREKEQAFLEEDYKLKITYLTNHFTRMWTRFNFFVTIEAALISGKFLIKSDVPSRELAIAGIVLSILWYVMGAEDRYLVRLYRNQVRRAGDKVAKTIWPERPSEAYRHVGQVDEVARAELRDDESEEFNKKPRWKQRLEGVSGWRRDIISTTRLASLFPLVVFVLWVALFIFNV